MSYQQLLSPSSPTTGSRDSQRRPQPQAALPLGLRSHYPGLLAGPPKVVSVLDLKQARVKKLYDFAGSTGLINGVPTTAGSFTFTVQVKDETRATDTETFTIEIVPPEAPTITTEALSSGTVGEFYWQLPRLPSTQSAGTWCVGLPGDHAVFGRDYVPAWLGPPARVGDRPAEGVRRPRGPASRPEPGQVGGARRRRTMRGICSGPRTASCPWAARSAAAARLWCKAGQGVSHQTGQESRSTGQRAGVASWASPPSTKGDKA